MSSKTRNISSEKLSEFGKRLKEAFNNISNQSIADHLGVGKSALTAYMQGRIPPPDKLIEIANISSCNLNWLLTGKGTKKNTPQIERPQGIILQGSGGGIGTSLASVFIASNLALRGYGVLLAADVLHTCSHLLLAGTLAEYKNLSPSLPEVDRSSSFKEIYKPTRNNNLDFFIPSLWSCGYPEQITKKFNFDVSEMNSRYQFVIFDTQRMEDPFDYPNRSSSRISHLEPILRNAQVLATYQPSLSYIEHIESIVEYVKLQKRIYPDAGFLGALITNRWKLEPEEEPGYTEDLKELKGMIGNKVFNSQIDFHKELSRRYSDFEKILFSRKTKLFDNFSKVVDELLQRLN